MKVLHVTASDGGSGSGRAVLRLNQALCKCGVDSKVRVMSKKSDDPRVLGPKGRIEEGKCLLRYLFAQRLLKMQRSENTCLRSLGLLSSGIAHEINQGDADIINLHWIGTEYVSIREVAQIRKPLIWTFHDMWAFCGAEHVSGDEESARWRLGYRQNGLWGAQKGLDVDSLVWRLKRYYWTKPLRVVCPSAWMERCVKSSMLGKNWPTTVVPNALNTDVFRPHEKQFARRVFGLPIDHRILLFGAASGVGDRNKGYDLLQRALEKVKIDGGLPISCVVFGSASCTLPKVHSVYSIGRVFDDYTLALLYSAADLTIVPSRIENLPQIATEAQACACPVIGFQTAGLSDAVADGITGGLVAPFDTDKLADAISAALRDDQHRMKMGTAARERAIRLWTSSVVADKYRRLYEQTLSLVPGRFDSSV